MMGEILTINAQGLMGSQRNRMDGCTIIGSQEQNPLTGEHFNDLVIKNENVDASEMNEVNTGGNSDSRVLSYDANSGIGKRHLVIKYSENDRRYYLRDLGDGSGTFVRVDNTKDLILKQGFIVSYGDSHMVVHLSNEMDPQANRLVSKITFKFLDGPKIDKTFTFSEEEEVIMIGRMSSCQIKFDDNSLSRLQCQIEYRRYDAMEP